MDVTMTKSGGRVRVELHTQVAEDWWDSVVDADYVSLGGSVYLVGEELAEALVKMMREHGGLNVDDG
jgi:hypothetical protein